MPLHIMYSRVHLYAFEDASHPNLVLKGTLICTQGCIPFPSCTQGYVNVHSRIHSFPIMYSRVHLNAFKDAFLPYHVHKDLSICIQGCIPPQSCTQGYTAILSRRHPFPIMYSRVHIYAFKDASLP
jgi:hypothetical protein